MARPRKDIAGLDKKAPWIKEARALRDRGAYRDLGKLLDRLNREDDIPIQLIAKLLSTPKKAWSRAFVTDCLNTARLHPGADDLFSQGKLSFTQAALLGRVRHPVIQAKIAEAAVRLQLNTRQMRQYIRETEQQIGNKIGPEKTSRLVRHKPVPVDTQKISRALGVPVEIVEKKGSPGKYRLEINGIDEQGMIALFEGLQARGD